MIYDYHVHSDISFDGECPIAACAEAARDMGIAEICITDHLDIGYPLENGCPRIDRERYGIELKKAREAFPRVVIKKGVETGLMAGHLGEIADDVRTGGYDFVIASQHYIVDGDPYDGDYFTGRTPQQAQSLYLEVLRDNITAFDDYDVIGHIGYVDKYLHNYGHLEKKPRPFEFGDYPELIDEILLSAINKGKGIEVNTSNYRVHGYPTPHPSILKRYAELGGEVLTIGSDSHQKRYVGFRVREAAELARSCGLEYVCTFTGRRPEFHRL